MPIMVFRAEQHTTISFASMVWIMTRTSSSDVLRGHLGKSPLSPKRGRQCRDW